MADSLHDGKIHLCPPLDHWRTASVDEPLLPTSTLHFPPIFLAFLLTFFFSHFSYVGHNDDAYTYSLTTPLLSYLPLDSTTQ